MVQKNIETPLTQGYESSAVPNLAARPMQRAMPTGLEGFVGAFTDIAKVSSALDKELADKKQQSALINAQAQIDIFNNNAKNIVNPEDYKKESEKFYKDLDENLQKDMGNYYLRFKRSPQGENFSKALQAENTITYNDKKRKELVRITTDNAKALIGTAGSVPYKNRDVRASKISALYDSATEEKDLNFGIGYISPEEAEDSKKAALHDLELNYIMNDVDNSPSRAIRDLNNPDKYKNVDYEEKRRFINQAEREIKARSGTANEETLEGIKAQWTDMYFNNNFGAQQQYDYMRQNPAETMKHYGISPKTYNSMMSYMGSIVNNPNDPRNAANAQKYADLTVDYNRFEIKKTGEIGNEDLNNPQAIYGLLTKLQDGVDKGEFRLQKADADKKIAMLRKIMGDKAKEISESGKPFFNATVFDNTLDKIVKGTKPVGAPYDVFTPLTSYSGVREYKTLKKAGPDEVLARREAFGPRKNIFTGSYPVFTIQDREPFTPEEMGVLSTLTLQTIAAEGIDLNSTAPSDITKAKEIAESVNKTFLKDKFNLNEQQFNTVATSGRVIPYASNGDSALGTKLEEARGYDIEVREGIPWKVRRDKNNKVVYEYRVGPRI